jgi:NAD(P)-dependent dehydrogenase (short-subunit alcohol dehydrogenase family)
MSESAVSAHAAPAATHRGRVAVVTGAARGLGAAIARGLARRGTPEDMVGTVLFLTGDDSEFVTAKFIAADGGYTHNY